jgi:hypothetical protein
MRILAVLSACIAIAHALSTDHFASDQAIFSAENRHEHTAEAEQDRVKSLPGAEDLDFDLFAGYVGIFIYFLLATAFFYRSLSLLTPFLCHLTGTSLSMTMQEDLYSTPWQNPLPPNPTKILSFFSSMAAPAAPVLAAGLCLNLALSTQRQEALASSKTNMHGISWPTYCFWSPLHL